MPMKTPIERIAEAANEAIYRQAGLGATSRLESANAVKAMLSVTPDQVRAVAAEVLRELIAQEFSSPWATWHAGVRESVHDFAASLGVEFKEKEKWK